MLEWMAALALGAGLDAYGKHKTASDAKKQAGAARDFYGDMTGDGMDRLGRLFYGDAWQDLLAGTAPRGVTPRPQEPRREQFGGGSTGGGANMGGADMPFNVGAYDRAMEQYRRDLSEWEAGEASRAKGREGALADFNAATGGPLLDQMRALAPYHLGAQQGLLSEFDRGTRSLDQRGTRSLDALRGSYARLDDMARGGEDLVGGWGAGREADIERDVGRARKAADQTTQARLAASGFGNSTAAAQALAGNARAFGELEVGAKRDLADTRIGLMQGARGQRLGVGMQGAAQEAALRDALLGRAYGRQAGKEGLMEATTQGQLALQQLPLQAMLALQQGNVLNPWLNQNTTQYFPQTSGTGSAFQSLGGAGAAVASQGLGSALYRQELGAMGGMDPELMKALMGYNKSFAFA